MDILSVLLGFLSLLQGLRSKKTLEEKVESLKKALSSIDQLYALLSLAKTVHDNYEQFGHAAMSPLKKSLEIGNLTNEQQKEHFDSFFQTADLFLSVHPAFAWNKSDLNLCVGLPVEIRNKISQIDSVFPEFEKSVSNFDKVLLLLKSSHKDSNYGRDLRDNVEIASHELKSATSKADRLILNTAHLLDFAHYQLKTAVDAI